MLKGLTSGYANCGKAMEVQGLNVEVLSKKISGHTANIICYYFMEGSKKIEITYYSDLGNNGSEIYFFKSAKDSQHYYSKNYSEGLESLPIKYVDIVSKLKAIHKEVFGESKIYTREDVIKDSEYESYEGKIVVLSARALNENHRSKVNQLWLATGGFGCNPTAIGTTVYATCLGDGENSAWRRGDFLGIYNGELTNEQKAYLGGTK